jgi:N-acetylmuramoyl-L-alanine amidase
LAERGDASLFISVHTHYTGKVSTGLEITSLVDTSTEGRLAAKRSILADTKVEGVQPDYNDTGEVQDVLVDWTLREITVIPARTRILVSMLREHAGAGVDATHSVKSDDITNEPSIRSLMTARVSSLLIQLGNIGHQFDADQIRSAAWQETVSKSIVMSLDTYFAGLHPP